MNFVRVLEMKSFFKNENVILVEVQKFSGLESWKTKSTFESYETGWAYYFEISVSYCNLKKI